MFDLRTYLPYLLNRVGFTVTDLFGEALAHEDLKVPMWRVLAVLWHEGRRSLSELSALTSIEISTLSRLIGTMQRRGLVVRRRSSRDGRAVTIGLTPRGKATAERFIPGALELERRMTTGLSPEEIEQLKLLLRKLFDNVAPSGEVERSA